MSNVYGFSHIILTTHERELSDPLLAKLYTLGIRQGFDHTLFKSGLLRNVKGNENPGISLYKSIDSSLPALELINYKSEQCRDEASCGFVFPAALASDYPVGKNQGILTNITPLSAEYISQNNLIKMAISEAPLRHRCSMGVWMTAKRYNQTSRWFKEGLKAKCILETEQYTMLTSRVMNKKFTNILWILVRDNQGNQASYFNDDSGMSTLGWLVKDLELPAQKAEKLGFNVGPVFEIKLSQRLFQARFIYDNCTPSFELLKLKTA